MRWMSIDGKWTFGEPEIVFNGEPVDYDGRTGNAIGLAMSDTRFAGGRIRATVEFASVSEINSAEIVFYYVPGRRWFVSAGIGGPNRMFTIRHWDGKWQVHAAGGDRGNLVAGQKYELEVIIRGSEVALAVNGVNVLAASLPFPLPTSQVGLSCMDRTPIKINDFKVAGERGKVFVVMQFSSPFNELHTEVIKRMCEQEFHLDAVRADELYGPGLIIADVARDIRQSEFVIAEITPANPNVYYELGFAHAINKPTILLADKATAKLPFDIAPFRTLLYENSIAGKRLFEEALRKHIHAIVDQNPIPNP